jgi:hypothetical protein
VRTGSSNTHGERGGEGAAVAGERREERAGEQREGDDRRHRVAGEAEPGDLPPVGTGERAEGERAAGAHAHAPEGERAAGGDGRRAHVVALADAHAAGREHEVARERAGAGEERTERRLGVGGDAEVDRLAAGVAHERGERDRVRRDDRPSGAGLGGPSERHELVARGDDGHAWPPHHLDLCRAQGGEQPGHARRHARAGRHGDGAGRHVLAGGAHVAARGAAARRPGVARVAVEEDEHAGGVVGIGARVLDAHHGVGAARDGGAGGDAHRRARVDVGRGRLRRGVCGGGHPQRHRAPGARAAHVGRAHRVAVHRRVRPRRHVGRRGHVPREHAADGVGERDHLAA